MRFPSIYTIGIITAVFFFLLANFVLPKSFFSGQTAAVSSAADIGMRLGHVVHDVVVILKQIILALN